MPVAAEDRWKVCAGQNREEYMARDSTELLQGTLELLVLKTLSLEPMHGWGISQRIQQMSKDVFQVNQGSLYPALQRMKNKGWITSEWRVTENNRRARYYALTPVGERQLGRELSEWRRASTAVDWILGWSGAGA
jgi:PadR family transcriptional regulator, regulatory protein PadR